MKNSSDSDSKDEDNKNDDNKSKENLNFLKVVKEKLNFPCKFDCDTTLRKIMNLYIIVLFSFKIKNFMIKWEQNIIKFIERL
jgi:hypothetical protein